MSVLRFLPRFRGLDSALRDYEDREQWTAGDIQGYQLQRLNAVWQHACAHVTHYRELKQSLSLPPRFDSIQQFTQTVPLLSKDIVRRSPERFLSRRRQPGSWHRTGGSTGTPTQIYWEHEAHLEMLRGKYRSEQAHGLDVFDRKVIFWGHAGSFAPGWRGAVQKAVRPVEDRLRNRLRLSAYDVSHQYLEKQVPIAQAFNPKSIYGYSCAVHLLSRAIPSGSLPDLKVAILTAEPACHRMLGEVERNLNCRAVIEYGAVECGLMAYLMPDRTLRTRDDLVLIETIPDELGEYEIVVTVLGNPSFPLLRYAIEDTTPTPRTVPEQGFGVLSEIHGRSNDFLIGKNGRRLHSMAVKHKLEHWPQIRRFTVSQNRGGELTVVVEPQPSASVSSALLSSLKSEIQEMLEGYPVKVESVSQLSGNLAGKHRWIVSELAQMERLTT